MAQTATPAVRPPPFPTPTPNPPAKCRFSDGVELSVPVLGAASGVITPGVVPARYQGTPGWITVAHGEPQPGLVLELRLPATMFVAGAVISPEVRVQNGTTTDVGVFAGVGTYGDDQQPINTADSRSVMNGGFHSRPGIFGGTVVPVGQAWSFPTMLQLPFEASQPIHLRAVASVGAPLPEAPGGQVINVFTDIPIHLTAAGSGQQLHVELQADHQQWCIRATTSCGALPDGPLTASMVARMGSSTSFRDPSVIAGNTWAGYWDSSTAQSRESMTVAVWVGGLNYATTQAVVTMPAAP